MPSPTGVPHRDLVVSPDHAIFVDGKLICARQLVNGTTIRQETGWTAVDYYHVELDRHAILIAEGLLAESYIDTGNRGFFANSRRTQYGAAPRSDRQVDYPTREAGSCVPFVWDEAGVRAVWQRLAERAAALAGRSRPPRRQKMPACRFSPRAAASSRPTATAIWSSSPCHVAPARCGWSHAAWPTDARPWLEDRRRLGVRVARIVLRGANEVREVPVVPSDLVSSWWAVEHDGADHESVDRRRGRSAAGDARRRDAGSVFGGVDDLCRGSCTSCLTGLSVGTAATGGGAAASGSSGPSQRDHAPATLP